MHFAFLNPQGNFDPLDSYWTEHPDFGGQLVYVKHVALALAEMGHTVDILTRQICDAEWPEFRTREDHYAGSPNVRVLRLPAGPPVFLRKELLWPHIVRDWVPNILRFYSQDRGLPDVFTAHYADGGISGVLLSEHTGVPFTFTAHSLGAQKMESAGVTFENLAAMDAHFNFACRIFAERLSMNRSALIVTSTRQERFEQYSHRVYREAVDVGDDHRFAVIPPGVNLSIFGRDVTCNDEVVTQAHIRDMLARDLAPHRREFPAIIASSRLDPKKNHLNLVRAYAESCELQARANLVLFTGALNDALRDDAGAESEEREVLSELRQVVRDRHLWGKVTSFALHGQLALAAAYRYLAQRGSVFALTALFEPFGLGPLEAAAAGLPLVVTRNGGPSESLRDDHGDYAVLVDPADPEDIARGLLRLLQDHAAWVDFAERGRQRVLGHYTWDRTAAGYLAHAKAIIADPRTYRYTRRLPLHPLFEVARLTSAVEPDGQPVQGNKTALEELRTLYFGDVESRQGEDRERGISVVSAKPGQ
ncbi:MAG: glycosyltransferase [Anaerolineae bacterium]|jgi:sucrose-phosphate synthase|nr:glycosyltransferase [Anaerolineae bacterium]